MIVAFSCLLACKLSMKFIIDLGNWGWAECFRCCHDNWRPNQHSEGRRRCVSCSWKKKRGKHADRQSKKWSSSVALYEDGRFLPWEQSEIGKIQQLNAHLLITFWRWGTVLRPRFLSDPKCRDWGQEITPKVFIPTNQIEMLGASRASGLDGVVWWQWGRIPGRYTEPKTQINTWKHSEEYSEFNKSAGVITTHVVEQSGAGVAKRPGFNRRRWWADDLQVRQEPEATPTNTDAYGEGAGEGGRRREQTRKNTAAQK